MKKFACVPGLYQYLGMRAMFQFFGKEFAELPEITEGMLKYGEGKSPEYACLPFKIYLGFFRELAKTGVNDVLIHGTRNIRACRYLDLWAGIQKYIREEGYHKFTFHFWGGYGAKYSFRQLQKIMGGPSYIKMIQGILVYTATLQATDEINDLANYARPRAEDFTAVDKWLKHWLRALKAVRSRRDLPPLLAAAKAEFSKIKLDRSRQIPRLALVGDLFKVHEPFFHFDTIRKLNRLGVEVKQPQSFSLLFIGSNKLPSRGGYSRKFREYQKKSKKYLRSLPASYLDLGVGEAVAEVEAGAKGIVHFQSFGCMPDIMLKPILDRIGRDYRVPVLHFMRDTHASDTAYQTRLEAFVDLIKRQELKK
jgi:predicted nucleotide-binding protein (sugar kinase/HSP70/actin superfamily)